MPQRDAGGGPHGRGPGQRRRVPLGLAADIRAAPDEGRAQCSHRWCLRHPARDSRPPAVPVAPSRRRARTDMGAAAARRSSQIWPPPPPTQIRKQNQPPFSRVVGRAKISS
ncbi:hypothetical protein BS78_02G088600 [Paspalum vaginatum]|nr:hypothetical protein BS78_02G088600 [Paspalum vaginatum]KAJ1288433.1 hypothetical protein BS78_02G088600 [Paspalum vaginatum]KAJ1288434.1 hypothetical protein BS78_02G088600 [Paspalum vaginatum]KAJ1288435.1 hypothetical protein BS78_02G088600 [Paspalum vaginatum]